MVVTPAAFLVEGLFPFLSEAYDYLALLAPTMYLCKDIIGPRSLGKRLLTLQIINEGDIQEASPPRCVVRNVTLLICPIELLIAMLNPSRRLGDRLAGTRLQFCNEPIRNGTRVGPVIVVFIIVYAFILLIAFLLKAG